MGESRILAMIFSGAPGVERSGTVGAAGRKRRGVTGCLDQRKVKACVQCPRLMAGADQARSGQLG